MLTADQFAALQSSQEGGTYSRRRWQVVCRQLKLQYMFHSTFPESGSPSVKVKFETMRPHKLISNDHLNTIRQVHNMQLQFLGKTLDMHLRMQKPSSGNRSLASANSPAPAFGREGCSKQGQS